MKCTKSQASAGLTESAKDSLEAFSDRAGMTQFAVTSRLVEWFASQPETIQSAVLRRYPPEIEADIARLILKKMSGAKA